MTEPYFDKNRSSGVANYAKFWIEEYFKDPKNEPQVMEKLQVIFTPDSPFLLKAVKGFEYTAVFRQRLGRRRLECLTKLLKKIDPNRWDLK